MGRLARRYSEISLTVVSPDTRVLGHITGHGDIQFEFSFEEAYLEYSDEPQLAQQLNLVTHDLYRELYEQQRRAIREVTGLNLNSGPHWDARQRRYDERRERMLAAGISLNEYIEVTSTGIIDIDLRIVSGAFDNLGEEAFISEVESALSDLRLDWNMRLQELKMSEFGAVGPTRPR